MIGEGGDLLPGDLIPFAVCGHKFQVVLDGSGEEHVRVAELARAAGLTSDSQGKRVKAARWARHAMIATRGSDGKLREFLCIPVKKTVMFFATLDPARAPDDFRPVLERFQDEISDAVHDYIAKGGAVRPAATVGQLEELRDFIVERLLRDIPRTAPAWPDAFVKRYCAWNGNVWRSGEKHPRSMSSANWFFYTMIFPAPVLAIIKARGLEEGCRYHQTLEDRPHAYLADQLDIVTRIANDCASESVWRVRLRSFYGKTRQLLAGELELDL